MADIIHLLPESLSNQIAAGEVIQRPASVVKELLENAIDAGADEIKLIVKDAGRTLVQVIDNGSGMSETDARMAFERHATSKISKSDDLFAIRTRGFRGEALAAIAAVANVELKTRLHTQELGTHIIIAASEVKVQETVQIPAGSNFIVRDLFYNVPARRKFLKSNQTEIRHIITELQRVALVNQDIQFSFFSNEELVYAWQKAHLKQRISQVIKNNATQELIPIEINTEIVKIGGFITKPEYAKKSAVEQFFFANGRFMRHPYFHKAVQMAYENLVSADAQIAYYIYFELNPAEIDVNIHPTKTEIKFSEAKAIFQILHVSVKEALGKYNITPSIDFDQEGNWGIHSPKENKAFIMPEVDYDASFNPFENHSFSKKQQGMQQKNVHHQDWEKLFDGFEQNKQQNVEGMQEQVLSSKLFSDEDEEWSVGSKTFFQFKKDYFITSVKSGLMLIHRRRAFERVLFDDYFRDLEANKMSSQQLLYPEEIEMGNKEILLLEKHALVLEKIGFDCSFTPNRLYINGLPPGIGVSDIPFLIDELFVALENGLEHLAEIVNKRMAEALAKAGTFGKAKVMTELEMEDLAAKLFATSSPNFTNDGKKILHVIKLEDLKNIFK